MGIRENISRTVTVPGAAIGWLLGTAQNSTRLTPRVYLALHLSVAALMAGVLAFFSTEIIAEAKVGISGNQIIQRYYCGIVFFCFYVVIRVAVWIAARSQKEEASEFPDIDQAWQDELETLAEAGLDIRELPVFLVVGISEAEEPDFFSAARFDWHVSTAISREWSPLRIYANKKGVFVSCAGICASSLRGGAVTQDVAEQFDELPPAVESSDDSSLAPPGFAQTMQPGQHAAIMEDFAQPPRTPAPPKAAKPAAPASEEQEAASRKLAHVCRLLSQLRTPFCPMNGLLLVAPLDEASPQAFYQDLQTVREQCRLVFPVIVVFSGLHRITGFDELLERGCGIDERFRDTRAGSRFPTGNEVDDAAAKSAVGRAFDWFRGWIYSEFPKDISNPENQKLYRMICKLAEHRSSLELLLKQSLREDDDGGIPRLSGCYFCACGPNPKQKAFVHGVLRKLMHEQDEIAWSDSQLEAESKSRNVGYALMAAIGLLVAANGFFVWRVFS